MSASPHQSTQFDILLIEHSEADIALLRMALEDTTVYCRVDVVKDGTAALQHLRRRTDAGEPMKPDLILLDLHLPGREGRSILEEIGQDEALRDIPLILLTGMSDDRLDGGTSAHAGRCIRKPSDRASFNRLVTEIEDACARIA